MPKVTKDAIAIAIANTNRTTAVRQLILRRSPSFSSFDMPRAHAQGLATGRPAQSEVKESDNAKVDHKWCVPRFYYLSAHGDYGH